MIIQNPSFKLGCFILIGILAACQSDVKSEQTVDNQENVETEVTISSTPNNPEEHLEYHPNGKLKIKGKLNANGNRQGLWIAYYDNGIKWSESYYTDGKRDGHTLTFHPNGQVRYVGEYKNDLKIGLWRFYDESGELEKEENY